jgi:hypothetical protein
MHRGAVTLLGTLVTTTGAMLSSATCEKNIARPPVEEVPIREASESTPPAATKDKPERPEAKPAADPKGPDKGDLTSTAPPLTAAAKDDPEPPRDRAFPKQADTCKKDEDCAATNLALGGDLMCCSPCRPVAGTRAWVRRVEQVCQQKSKTQKTKCAPYDCAKPDAECRSGKCVVK